MPDRWVIKLRVGAWSACQLHVPRADSCGDVGGRWCSAFNAGRGQQHVGCRLPVRGAVQLLQHHGNDHADEHLDANAVPKYCEELHIFADDICYGATLSNLQRNSQDSVFVAAIFVLKDIERLVVSENDYAANNDGNSLPESYSESPNIAERYAWQLIVDERLCDDHRVAADKHCHII